MILPEKKFTQLLAAVYAVDGTITSCDRLADCDYYSVRVNLGLNSQQEVYVFMNWDEARNFYVKQTARFDDSTLCMYLHHVCCYNEIDQLRFQPNQFVGMKREDAEVLCKELALRRAAAHNGSDECLIRTFTENGRRRILPSIVVEHDFKSPYEDFYAVENLRIEDTDATNIGDGVRMHDRPFHTLATADEVGTCGSDVELLALLFNRADKRRIIRKSEFPCFVLAEEGRGDYVYRSGYTNHQLGEAPHSNRDKLYFASRRTFRLKLYHLVAKAYQNERCNPNRQSDAYTTKLVTYTLPRRTILGVPFQLMDREDRENVFSFLNVDTGEPELTEEGCRLAVIRNLMDIVRGHDYDIMKDIVYNSIQDTDDKEALLQYLVDSENVENVEGISNVIHYDQKIPFLCFTAGAKSICVSTRKLQVAIARGNCTLSRRIEVARHLVELLIWGKTTTWKEVIKWYANGVKGMEDKQFEVAVRFRDDDE